MSGCGASEEDIVSQLLPATSNKACSNPNGCSKSGCQQQHKQQGSFGSWVRRQDTKDSAAQAAQDLHQLQRQQQQDGTLGNCMKCKKHPAVLHIRQQEPYCNECLETGVLQKFRTCTKAQGIIKTGDNVLLALSGGAASLSLLYSAMAMKSSNMNRPERGKVPFQLSVVHVDHTAARGVPMEQAQGQVQQLCRAAAAAGFIGQVLVVPLHAVFATQEQLLQLLQVAQQQQQQQQPGVLQLQQQLDAVHLAAAEAAQATADGQQDSTSPSAAAAAAPADCVVNGSSTTSSSHAAPAQQQQWQQQLCDLLSRVSDTTGREDLARHLQDSLLMRAAAALGCGRLLRGECADRVAANIIAEAAKGRGFSLPGDIQLLDARMLPDGGPAVLRPLREVTYKELVGLCAYKNIPWSDRAMGQPAQWQLPAAAGNGKSSSTSKAGGHAGVSLNALSERFIADMAGSVPASIYTILRTASHLQPFDFSEVAAVPGAVEVQSSAIRQSVHNRQQAVHGSSSSDGCRQQWQLCAVCRAPLPAHTQNGNTVDAAAMDRLVLAGLTGAHSRQLCYSCNRQILYNVQPDAADEMVAGAEKNLEARMQRLRQLLPPGMLLQDDEV